jgi:uncharacterized glyoxalase superfamily protein PhnB
MATLDAVRRVPAHARLPDIFRREQMAREETAMDQRLSLITLGVGKLARDSGVQDPGGWGGVALAYNVRSPAEVDAVLAEARDAGATIARSAATVWGGYSGVFIDPDGHPWEVAHNPAWSVQEDGRTTID